MTARGGRTGRRGEGHGGCVCVCEMMVLFVCRSMLFYKALIRDNREALSLFHDF